MEQNVGEVFIEKAYNYYTPSETLVKQYCLIYSWALYEEKYYLRRLLLVGYHGEPKVNLSHNVRVI